MTVRASLTTKNPILQPQAPAVGAVRFLAPPLSCAAILANDALAPDATAHKADWLAKQASRRWL